MKKGNPDKITGLDDFCGKTVALQRGTTQDDVAEAQAAKCQKAGKPLKVLRSTATPRRCCRSSRVVRSLT